MLTMSSSKNAERPGGNIFFFSLFIFFIVHYFYISNIDIDSGERIDERVSFAQGMTSISLPNVGIVMVTRTKEKDNKIERI